MEAKIYIKIDSIKIENSRLVINLSSGNPLKAEIKKEGLENVVFDEIVKNLELKDIVSESFSSELKEHQDVVKADKAKLSDDNDERGVSELLSWLKSIGASVRNYKTGDPQPLLRLAKHMGDKYEDFKPVYEKIKSTLSRASTITMKLNKFPSVAINYILNICKEMEKLGFLRLFEYKKSPYYTLVLAVNPLNSEAKNFLSGHWLEKWVKITLIEALRDRGINYSYLQELQVVLPDGLDDEIDLLFDIAGTKFILECKTAKAAEKIPKYVERAEKLKISPENNILIALDMNESEALEIGEVYGMRVMNLEMFKSFAKKLAEKLASAQRTS